MPLLGDDAEPVAVAVEGEADLGIALPQRCDEVGKIFGLRRIGVMVGKAPVDFAE